jgi:hypothetical protein
MNRPHTIVIAFFFFCAIVLFARHPTAQSSTQADSQDVAADAAASTATFRQALIRHRPVYRFDSEEQFFPLSVNSITNNAGNQLRRNNDFVLARRHQDGSGLNISWLRPNLYPTDEPVLESDKLRERHGSSDPDADYLRDARRMQRNASFRDRIYARIRYTRDEDGDINGAWLQYWVFYYYNSFHQGPFGKHEGDWEMVQIQVNANATPQRAAYAQHNTGSLCDWDHMRRTGSGNARPIVYVGGGSHASYFTSGTHNVPDIPGGDRADGKNPRRLNNPRVRVVSENTRWIKWPGFWGSTKSTVDFIPTESPKGPAFQGAKWANPDAWANSIDGTDHCK